MVPDWSRSRSLFLLSPLPISLSLSLALQDYYTAVNVFRPEYFYHLPCEWNRQLCMMWFLHVQEPTACHKWQTIYHCVGAKILHFNCFTFQRHLYAELLHIYNRTGDWPPLARILREQCDKRKVIGAMHSIVPLKQLHPRYKALLIQLAFER